MNQWEIIPEMDDEETGEHAGWYLEINSEKYGKYVWITKMPDGYHVEIDSGDFITLVICKSLTSAKRWVTINIKNKA